MPRSNNRNRRPQDAETSEERFKLQFGENLYLLRVTQKISQEELARRAGIHRTQMSLYENGERLPMADSAHRVAAALGVSLDRLFQGIEWIPPDSDDKTATGFYEFPEPASR